MKCKGCGAEAAGVVCESCGRELDEAAATVARVMGAESRSAAREPLPVTGGPPPRFECPSCGREPGIPLVDGVVIFADGAEHVIEYRPCAPCDAVTVAIVRRSDGRAWCHGPIERGQAEAHVSMPPYCDEPGRSDCGCESHRFFKFLFFKYGWGAPAS